MPSARDLATVDASRTFISPSQLASPRSKVTSVTVVVVSVVISVDIVVMSVYDVSVVTSVGSSETTVVM